MSAGSISNSAQTPSQLDSQLKGTIPFGWLFSRMLSFQIVRGLAVVVYGD